MSEFEGVIEIPETARRVLGKIGVCCGWSPYKHRLYQLWVDGRMQTVEDAWKRNNVYAGMEGKKVIIETARLITASLYDVKLEHIVAIDPNGEAQWALEKDVERCSRCRSAGEFNMMMDSDGYCIQCGCNSRGEHKDQKEITVSDDFVHEFGQDRAEYMRRADPNRGKETSNVITYPGMDKRS